MEEVRQLQDDAVSSNGLSNSNLLNNLAHWDVSSMTTPGFNEIYACAQEGDDDDVLPFEALLDPKSNDANNAKGEPPWIDTNSSSCENMGASLTCVEGDDFQVIQSLGAMGVSSATNNSTFILETTNNALAAMKETILLPEDSDFVSKMASDVNSNKHVVFLNSQKMTRQTDRTAQYKSVLARTTFENCVKTIQNSLMADITCFNQNSEQSNSLFHLDDERADGNQDSVESNGMIGGRLSIGDAVGMDGDQDVFAVDENSSSFMEVSNHSSTESSHLPSQYANQLVYADLSGSASKETNFQNNAVFVNSLHLSGQLQQQQVVLSPDAQQKLLLQNQSKAILQQQLGQQSSLPLNQHFILHQNPTQMISPQLQSVFQQLKVPQQIIRTTFQKNLLETTSNLLSGHLSLSKVVADDHQGPTLIGGANIKSTKSPRNRNQANRSGRTDATVSGKPNSAGPTNEKDSQELERVMNILKHYKQQIASNDQESQFLPCKRKRSKPPETITSCSSAGTSNINSLSQSKLVTSAVIPNIPNLNLSFSLSIKSLESKTENLTSHTSTKTCSEFGTLPVTSSDQLNILTVSNSAHVPTTKNLVLVTSAAQSSANPLISAHPGSSPARSFLASQSSQTFPFSLQVPVSNALSRPPLCSMQSGSPTTLQLSIKNLTKLVGLPSGSTAAVETVQSSEAVQQKVVKSLAATSFHQINSQVRPTQHQILSVSQALAKLQQLNSNQKLSNPQQILLNSLIQKNLPQFLQLSIRQGANVTSVPTTTQSVLQNASEHSTTNTSINAPVVSSDLNTPASKCQNSLVPDSPKTCGFVLESPSPIPTHASPNGAFQENLPRNYKNDISSPTAECELTTVNDKSKTKSKFRLTDVLAPPPHHDDPSSEHFDPASHPFFNSSCNKVKLELNRKLKAAPINRTPVATTTTTTTTMRLPLSFKTLEPQDRGINLQPLENADDKLETDPEAFLKPESLEGRSYGDFRKDDCGRGRDVSVVAALERCSTLSDIRGFLIESFNVEESDVRIEKLEKSATKAQCNSWDPTPKSILKRSGPEEKMLCLVTPTDGAEDEKLSIFGIVLWESVEERTVASAFDCLSALFQVESDKKRKVRGDKPLNATNLVWNLSESCDLQLTSSELIHKLDRIRESCEVVNQLSRKVSDIFVQFTSDVGNKNMWDEATLLSNNSDENHEDMAEMFCHVPLRRRMTDDTGKSKKDMGIWRVFPGCVLSRTDEDSAPKKANSNRSKNNKMEAKSRNPTAAEGERFPSRGEVSYSSNLDSQPRQSAGEAKKPKNLREQKERGRENSVESDERWADKSAETSSGKRKRKAFESEPALKLKIKKVNPDDKSPVKTEEPDQDVDEDSSSKPKQQHYYCVRPRRQKSQRQIEHEQLQQQRFTRNSNPQTRQRQQKTEENPASDSKSRASAKGKGVLSRAGDKNLQEEATKTTNSETRNRLTMKLRDKISPRANYASGVFMALSQGSLYLEMPRPDFSSTSLTNCSTNQLCLRLQRRKPLKSETYNEEKTTCSTIFPHDDSAGVSEPDRKGIGYSSTPPEGISNAALHFARESSVEESPIDTALPAMATEDHDCLSTAFSLEEQAFMPGSPAKAQEVSSGITTANPLTVQDDRLPFTIKSPKVEIPDLPRPLPTPHSHHHGSQPAPYEDDELGHATTFFTAKVKNCTGAPVNCAVTMTTDTLVTKWIKPKLATTGPYQCWD